MRNSYEKLFICLIVLSLFFSLSTCRDTLTLTQSLSDGETLISSGKTFALGFFTPANSNNSHRYVGIWYNSVPAHSTFIWVANRKDPIEGTTGILSIVDNGTLVLMDGVNSTIIWSFSSTRSVTNPIARVLDTGNFVITNNDDLNNYAWQSFDYPTDTYISGMKLGVDLTTGLNRNLTSWSSSTDPSPGNYTFVMDLDGVPQLIFWAGSSRKLRSGPWNGQEFGGLAPYENSLNTTLRFNFVNNKEEVSYTMDVLDKSIIARTVVNESGVIQLFVWVDSGSWVLYWYSPRTQCDSYLACGPSGAACYTDGTPMCSCLPGFLPKSQMNWGLRDWSGGCIRKTELDCRNRTDGFVTVKQTLLPDTVRATVDMEMSLDECRVNCLRNCSCTAYASADIRGDGGGSGCITWSTDLSDILVFTEEGQDLYMRLAAADIGSISNKSHKSKKATLAVVLSIVLGILAILVLASAVFYKLRKRRTRGNTPITAEHPAANTIEDDIELPLFDVETIVAATDSFSDQNKLGEGGFGPVYKGKMKEGHEVAVKRLSKTSLQGIDELMTEVKLVAKLQHRNLVRLLGCCIQRDERMLIYEYMPNKSLDAFLFDEEKVVLLDWQTRCQIILGIARGLLYLHEDSRFRIIHRDLKASNILLDKDMNPKISDFGMARIFGGDDTRTTTRKVVGTYGYMSPEYALNGIFSVKSDVFSFGVLVLEIISGKRNRGVYLSEPEEFLLGNVWTLWREGNILKLPDASMNGSFSVSEVLRCINVGLLCIQERSEDRPTMSSVFLMLSNDQVSLKEPLQPGFVARNRSLKESSSCSISSYETMHSVNDVTITTVVAR